VAAAWERAASLRVMDMGIQMEVSMGNLVDKVALVTGASKGGADG
jgi:hypothetical protein